MLLTDVVHRPKQKNMSTKLQFSELRNECNDILVKVKQLFIQFNTFLMCMNNFHVFFILC